MTISRYHYTGCGLDYVYLLNGFEVKETPYGTGVSIDNADDLHRAVALSIISSRARIRGQEVRFLRGRIDLSQADLGRVLGVTRDAVAKWEAVANKPIPGTADRLLRMFIAPHELEDEKVKDICELLREIDNQTHQDVTFKEGPLGWTREAA